MLKDEISLLSFFSLKDSEKEEAEGASVVVGFDPHQDHDKCPTSLGASLLCMHDQLTYKPNIGPKRKPQAHGPKKMPQASP